MVRECSNNIARGRPEPVDHFDDDFDFDSHFSNMANDIQARLDQLILNEKLVIYKMRP